MKLTAGDIIKVLNGGEAEYYCYHHETLDSMYVISINYAGRFEAINSFHQIPKAGKIFVNVNYLLEKSNAGDLIIKLSENKYHYIRIKGLPCQKKISSNRVLIANEV